MTVVLASCAACSQKMESVSSSSRAESATPVDAVVVPSPPAAADPRPAPHPSPRMTARPPAAIAVPPSAIYAPEVMERREITGSAPLTPNAASGNRDKLRLRPPTAALRVEPPKASAESAINDWPFASQLSKSDIAFNTPDKMVMGETADMQLIIDPSKTSEEIKKEIKAEGEKVGATVLVSKVVIVKVLAPDFDVVELVNKGRQAIDFNGPTEWKWTISPKSKGSHKIHLTITAVIQIDGDKAERLIKTFDKEIVVVVTPKQVIVGFFEKYWQWLFTTLLLPLGLWLWKRYKGKEE